MGITERTADAEWAELQSLRAEVRRLTAALDLARREGAAAMRTEGIEACERIRKNAAERFAEAKGDPSALYASAVMRGACEAADMCGNAIRALPLDAPGGGS